MSSSVPFSLPIRAGKVVTPTPPTAPIAHATHPEVEQEGNHCQLVKANASNEDITSKQANHVGRKVAANAPTPERLHGAYFDLGKEVKAAIIEAEKAHDKARAAKFRILAAKLKALQWEDLQAQREAKGDI